ncbi:MAG: hypothetical protein QS721_11190 [Candidatus Endonucleobacter sp. (ex Gigantidas childressi)]|nr:hypothetical protein [Candidatus Endonucleobacter sp. (ex Gigantidas childressi)]
MKTNKIKILIDESVPESEVFVAGEGYYSHFSVKQPVSGNAACEAPVNGLSLSILISLESVRLLAALAHSNHLILVG